MPYPEPEFVVQELFAIGSACLLTGASGAGKSHLCYQIADDLLEGNPIFGFKCTRKIRPIYFCYDRPITGVHHTLNRMGLDFTGRMELKSYALEDDLAIPTKKDVGDANFIFMDGLDILCPRIIDLGSGMSVMRRCQKLAFDCSAGMLGVTGHSKQKGDNSGYVLSREKSIGTTAFGRGSESMLVLDYDPIDFTGNTRILTLNVRDDPTQRITLEFNQNSWLLPIETKIKPLSDTDLLFLEALPFDTILTREPLLKIASTLKRPIKQSKMYECLKVLEQHHKIVQSTTGQYRKVEFKTGNS